MVSIRTKVSPPRRKVGFVAGTKDVDGRQLMKDIRARNKGSSVEVVALGITSAAAKGKVPTSARKPASTNAKSSYIPKEPATRYVTEIKSRSNTNALFERICDEKVTLSVGEILGAAPDLRKRFKQEVTPH